MSYKLVFTDEAEETFELIKAQVFNRWGNIHEAKFIEKSDKIIKIILQSPFIYEAVSNTPSVRKALIHKNCSMYYEISEDYLVILFFWDNRQDPLFL